MVQSPATKALGGVENQFDLIQNFIRYFSERVTEVEVMSGMANYLTIVGKYAPVPR